MHYVREPIEENSYLQDTKPDNWGQLCIATNISLFSNKRWQVLLYLYLRFSTSLSILFPHALRLIFNTLNINLADKRDATVFCSPRTLFYLFTPRFQSVSTDLPPVPKRKWHEETPDLGSVLFGFTPETAKGWALY